MRITALFWLCLSITALAAPEGGGDQQDSANWSSFRNSVKTMSFTNPGITIPTQAGNLGNLPPPPRSLINEVISAVPPSVLVDLVVPSRRASLASEFSAGNTPGWYKTLPTDVKSYVKEVKSEIKNGALTATTGPASQTATATTTGTAAGSTAASSTSSGAAAGGARATGGPLAASAAGALGMLGVAIVL
ncbi:hypothetical protein PHISP_03816 [Aspergillus sp. HF37]|nr:hypothetical protein PHISP_03816 [Aspergillus sp. HF37]